MNINHFLPQINIIQSLAKKRKLEVFLVGGFLRDSLFGREKLDFDFAVSKCAVALARSVANAIKGAFVLLDQEHGCARVVKKIDGKIVTFDFADYRAKNFKADLALRDFTVNTFYVALDDIREDIDLRKVIKGSKQAFEDLRKRTIRMTSSKAFLDDPLRMLRAYSLKAIFNFKIEAQTKRLIVKQKDLITHVSMERVRDELFKIFESTHCYEIVVEMDQVGILERIIPQIHVMFGCVQGGYHHLDVWKHSLEALKCLEKVFKSFSAHEDVENYLSEVIDSGHSRRALIRLGLLLHDIGKPETKKKEKDRFTFHGHEHVGRSITRHIARQLKCSKKERFILEDLVLYHLRPGYLSNFATPTQKMIYRFFRDTKENAVAILILSLADQAATRGKLTTQEDQEHHAQICHDLINRYFQKQKEKPFVPLITGKDLISKLKLKPSPLFGKILKEVAEAQSLNKVTTKQQALDLAEEISHE